MILDQLFLINQYLLPFLIVFTGFVIYSNYKSRFLDYILAIIAAGAISEGIKYLTNFPRPVSIYVFEGSSFPSGHTTIAFTAFFFYLLACHTLSKKNGGAGQGEGQNWLIVSLMLVMAISVAILRIAIGAHYITDIFAGIILAFIISLPFKYYDVSGRKIR